MGTYGLPQPTTGCPSGWATGSRRHDTEDSNPANTWSTEYLRGYFDESIIRQYFCMKTVSRADSFDWPFPAGQYCVYKKGSTCPNGKIWLFCLLVCSFVC